MRVVLQRVSRAEVGVGGRVTGSIGVGFVVLVGFAPTDTDPTLEWMAEKILTLRVFGDAAGKMNLALDDVAGALLVVAQVTLHGGTHQGPRPGLVNPAPPAGATPPSQRVGAPLRGRGGGTNGG